VHFTDRTVPGVPAYEHILSPLVYDVLLPLARLVLSRSKYDVYHALSETQGWLFPLIRPPRIVTIHHVAGAAEWRLSTQARLYGMFSRWSRRIAVQYASHIIADSAQTKMELVTACGVSESKITVVHLGIDGGFVGRERAAAHPVIGYLGALNKRKNVGALITATAELWQRADIPASELWIYGDGPDRDELETLARDLGISHRVKFWGRVRTERLPECYSAMSVFVLPSFHEGFGFPVLEAQSCGTPVIVFQNARIPVEVTQYAIKCPRVEELGDRIREVIEHPQDYETLVKEACAYAQGFTWERTARETVAVYMRMAAR